jgi:hypothetical protein
MTPAATMRRGYADARGGGGTAHLWEKELRP